MMDFICNFPFFSIFLPIVGAVICLPLKGNAAKNISLGVIIINTILSALALRYTLQTGQSFTYMMGHFPAPFGNELRAGPLEALMALAFCLILLLSVTGGMPDIFKDIPEEKINYYFIMINMLLASLLAQIYTNDIFTAYIFIDILTITACSIVVAKPGGRTLIATTSYLIMSLIGSSLLLLAISLLYSVTGHLLLPSLYNSVRALAEGSQYHFPLFMLMGLLTIGLSIKSALFPFHGWLPNAHSNATTASSSILSGLIIKSYIFLLIKLFFLVFGLDIVSYLHIGDILMAFGLTGVLYGSLHALHSKDIKGMLSFASISQISYICFCIGVNTIESMAAACFHILTHAAAKSMLFSAAGGLMRSSGGKKDFDSLRGAGWRDKLAGTAFVCGALSMTGIPLFSGFASKLYLATAATGPVWKSALIFSIIILSTLLSAMYYLPTIACFFAKGPEQELGRLEKRPLIYKAALTAFITVNMTLGLASQPIYETIVIGIKTFLR